MHLEAFQVERRLNKSNLDFKKVLRDEWAKPSSWGILLYRYAKLEILRSKIRTEQN